MSDRVAEVMARIEAAKSRILATGELGERVGGGRAPARSGIFKRASADLHTAEQARNRLLVEMVGEGESVPAGLADRLGLTGRHAASLLRIARTGSARMRENAFG